MEKIDYFLTIQRGYAQILQSMRTDEGRRKTGGEKHFSKNYQILIPDDPFPFHFQGTLCAGGMKPGNEEVEILGRV